MRRLVALVGALAFLSSSASGQPAEDAGQRWVRGRIAWTFLNPRPRSDVGLGEFRGVAERAFATAAAGEAAVTRETLERRVAR